MVRDLLVVQNTSTDILDCISEIALIVAPASCDTDEEWKSSQEEYAAKRHSMLTPLAEGRLSSDDAHNVAALIEGMLRLLQLRHKRLSRERFGERLITSGRRRRKSTSAP